MRELTPAGLSFLLLLSGCNVFNTADSEGTRGRGARAFDPYSSSASGAIALSLLQFNGCAILPNGDPVGPTDLQIPGYPATCENVNTGIPMAPAEPPRAKMTVIRNQLYFLEEFVAFDTVFGLHTDFNDRKAPATWIRKQSRFKDLDWSGIGIGREEWRGRGLGAYDREVIYENAAWTTKLDDVLLVEVVDSSGNVRASQTYSRRDFLSENRVSGRTRVSWLYAGIKAPTVPADPVAVPSQDLPSYVQTGVKIAFSNSTDPFKTFLMPDVAGEGLIRVTWSQMPNQPFVWPVEFTASEARPNTCYKIGPDGLATDERVQCGFGMTQQVFINKPENGKFYKPGDLLEFQVSLRDGDGNGLHPRDLLPSYNQFISSDAETNGLQYFNEFMLVTYRDQSSSESGFMVAGPLDQMRLSDKIFPNYYRYPERGEPHYYIEPPGFVKFAPGLTDFRPPTRFSLRLPDTIAPGTYVIYAKGHRHFMGERLNRMDAFFFQVGQDEFTSYPGRVGNCQICHNGVLSLNNVMHGLSVDHVEGCKSCHNTEEFGQSADFIHRIHFSSTKYPQAKNDCTMCHLSRESALTPSLNNCLSCHPSAHGTEYFNLRFMDMETTPNMYTNCANACHVTQAPTQHVLPVQN